MKNKISRILCTALCCAPLLATAQTNGQNTSPQRLYQEGVNLFQQKAYSAAIPPLQAFIQQTDRDGQPLSETAERLEAEYMLVCAEYELRNPRSTELLQAFLEKHPDTPHANRLHDMTYRLAVSYLKTGNTREAATWFETLRIVSEKYAADCTYYLSYIRYTQQQYDDALKGFLSLQDDKKYQSLVPYYIAEIYLIKKNFDKAEIVAQNYLSAYSGQPDEAEMYRVLGTAEYHTGKYLEAMKSFDQYASESNSHPLRRDARYMQGLACYHCKVYTRVPELLNEVADGQDALAQNAWLHMGLAYLQLDDKNKARMAFEQAAASNADLSVKEQAAYNRYAPYLMTSVDTDPVLAARERTALKEILTSGTWNIFGGHGLNRTLNIP